MLSVSIGYMDENMTVITLALPKELLVAVDDFAKGQPVPTDRSKTIRTAISKFIGE